MQNSHNYFKFQILVKSDFSLYSVFSDPFARDEMSVFERVCLVCLHCCCDHFHYSPKPSPKLHSRLMMSVVCYFLFYML